MIDTIEFYPVEVIKNFLDLTVGDVLRINPNTGRYELKIVNEDISDSGVSSDSFEASFEPWVIQKYMDHFQIYEESKPDASEEVYEEGAMCGECIPEGDMIDEPDVDLDSLKADLEGFKLEFAVLKDLISDLKPKNGRTKLKK